MHKETYIVMDYYEFDELVKKTFPQSNFEFAADVESSNDTLHSFTVEAKPWGDGILDRRDLERISFLIKGLPVTSVTRAILRELAIRGIIEPGKYLIEVSW